MVGWLARLQAPIGREGGGNGRPVSIEVLYCGYSIILLLWLFSGYCGYSLAGWFLLTAILLGFSHEKVRDRATDCSPANC